MHKVRNLLLPWEILGLSVIHDVSSGVLVEDLTRVTVDENEGWDTSNTVLAGQFLLEMKL